MITSNYVLERRKICDSCDSLKQVFGVKTCKECGCAIWGKTIIPIAECPLKKWGKYDKKD